MITAGTKVLLPILTGAWEGDYCPGLQQDLVFPCRRPGTSSCWPAQLRTPIYPSTCHPAPHHHPQHRNLASLFGADRGSGGAPAPRPPAGRACAGASLDDQFDLRQLAVCVRIRPPITAGAPRWDSENCIHATSRHGLAIAPPPGSAAYAAGDRGQTYAFSAVFDEHTSQADYYAATTDALVRDCLSDPAHSSLIMAYGITAAGKTFTLEGSRRAPGLVPRALEALFAGRDARGAALRVVLSYFEIYNETIHDLLDEAGAAAPGARPSLRLKEDAEGRVFVAGLSQAEAASAEHALCLLRRGARQRARAETGLNYASSRSHSVFQVREALACVCPCVFMGGGVEKMSGGGVGTR